MATPTETPSFSYENDIKPMQKKYLDSISSRVSDPLVQTALLADNRNSIESDFIKKAKMEEIGLSNKGREVAYQSALVSLDQSRTDAANKRDMLQTLVPFQNQLDGVINDTSIDSAERKRQIGILGVKNAGLLTINEAAGKAFDAAKIGVGDTENKKLTVFDYVRAGGDTKYLTELNPDVTKVDVNQEINPAWMLDRLNKSSVSKQRQKDGLDIEQKRQEQSTAAADKIISDLGNVKMAKAEGLLPNENADKFDTAGHEFTVRNAVHFFGSPEEQEAFSKAKGAGEQFKIAQSAGQRYLQGKMSVGGVAPAAAPSPTSLFTSSAPKPEVPISPFPTK